MTFTEWRMSHLDKLVDFISSLSTPSISDVVDYFQYENMSAKHPTYCPLYAIQTRCHNTPDLNCLFCACPHFVGSDTPLHALPDGVKIMSVCSLGSKQSGRSLSDHVSQCDCSSCFIPHTRSHINHLLQNIHTKDQLISYLKEVSCRQKLT